MCVLSLFKCTQADKGKNNTMSVADRARRKLWDDYTKA